MAATTDAPVDLHPDGLEAYRRELTGYCYRMLGSAFEAEDAVQDTMLRAWQAADRFEGRSSVRSWLYKIATNVCLDMLRGRSRRARPMELGPACPPEESSLARVLPEHAWITPVADSRVLPEDGDPAEIAMARETIRLAFVTALQHLPPRQRAALILCEVLRWQAAETADLLGTSVAAVNSALQRARATMTTLQATAPSPDDAPAAGPAQPSEADLLARYVDAFERYDIDALVALLAADAVQTMPPFAMWLRGPADIAAWMAGPGSECASSRLLPVAASGTTAYGQYRQDPDGGHSAWSLQIAEISGGQIVHLNAFLDTAALFPSLGLPLRLPPQ
jgi:RNA polymerase sigma-70 factor (ECF subfamily)